MTFPDDRTLVDARWLADNIDDVVVIDSRWYLDGRDGREAYDSGHIPGARFVDLDTDLSAPPTRDHGRHPLPDPDSFAATLGRLGIDGTTPVVVYDDAGGVVAGRMWWMLDALGVPVAVLDGGLAAWDAELVTDDPGWTSTTFAVRPWPSDRFVTIHEVDQMTDDRRTLLLDARSRERYRGDPNPIDPRFGHIPGAVTAPSTANLGESGRLLDEAELRRAYTALGADQRPVVVYCGSGVSACLDLLALRRAGLPDGRLFVGSWSAWGADHDRPLETGPSRPANETGE